MNYESELTFYPGNYSDKDGNTNFEEVWDLNIT